MAGISGWAHAADIRLTPRVGITTTYTDNIFLEKQDTQEDVIIRMAPSLSIAYEGAHLNFDADYTYQYFSYTAGSREDEDVNEGQLEASIEIQPSLFLDISDTFGRTSLDLSRDFTEESDFLNQSDYNVFRVHPYARFQPHPLISLMTGFEFSDTWYEEDIGVDKEDYVIAATATYISSPKTTNQFNYRHLDETNEIQDLAQTDINLSISYEYAEGSYFFLAGGYTWINFQAAEGYQDPTWHMELSYVALSTAISFTVARNFSEDPEGTITRLDNYDVKLTTSSSRYPTTLSLYVREFADVVIDEIDTQVIGGRLEIRHPFTDRLTGVLESLMEEHHQRLQAEDPSRTLVSLTFNYEVSESFLVTAGYRWNQSDTDTGQDEYESNRVVLELIATF